MTEWVRGGFRFTEDEDGLTIRSHAAEPLWRRLIAAGLFALCFAVGLSYLLTFVRGLRANGLMAGRSAGGVAAAKAATMLLVVLAVIGAVVLAWARPVLGGHERLRLAAREMTLTNVDFGVAWRTRRFGAGEVCEVRYKETGGSDTGAEFALEFRAHGRRVRMFRNCDAQVAAEIMAALASHGMR